MAGREKDCVWYFAPQIGGRDEGPNDALEQNFKGSPFNALIRESVQNSLDAVLDKDQPVRVGISFGSINGLNFPSFNELGEHIRGCIERFPDNEQAKDIYQPKADYFSDSYAQHMNIGYIKVADYNTKGMDYEPDKTNMPFYAFVRAAGVAAKDVAGAGGAYGFGKAAYFQLSPINTLLVSTLTDTGRHFFEGVSTLCTHLFRGEKKVSVGYYDNNGGEPVSIAERIPKPFRREEPGSDFYIMGFNYQDKEKNAAKMEMVQATLRNFWMAIADKKLEVDIDGIVISSESIEDMMNEYFPNILDETRKGANHNPHPYYEAYTKAKSDPKHLYFETIKPTLGVVKFYAFLCNDGIDKVAFFRGPRMTVFLKKNQTNYGFYGVFLCEDLRGNRVLRELENPAHDEWAIKNFRKADKAIGNSALDEYKEFVAECIKNLYSTNGDEGLRINGSEDLLYVPESLIDETPEEDFVLEGGNGNGYSGTPSGERQDNGSSMTSDIEDTEPNQKVLRTPGNGTVRSGGPDFTPDPDGKDKGGIRTRGKDKKKRKGRGNQPGPHITMGRKGEDNGQQKVYVSASYKVVAQRVDGVMYHDLLIRPEEDIDNGEIEITVGGDQKSELLAIVETSAGAPSGNSVSGLQMKAEAKNTIRIRFADNLRHSIILAAYDYQ